ncbi:hypothetical protein N7457_007637 [Penicillium paradoxum]|uniref:uncharacterized protein n=1 Tax=Penicillium paradoxum TaxID=176176 RepID=UPI0025469CC3|nr:uncharacterized protein N7457_007637 [Penicillium paradoxum]KAJ5772741.1 hypothetical protein N7457_007637 [Penicillium paradoxum]
MLQQYRRPCAKVSQMLSKQTGLMVAPIVKYPFPNSTFPGIAGLDFDLAPCIPSTPGIPPLEHWWEKVPKVLSSPMMYESH